MQIILAVRWGFSRFSLVDKKLTSYWLKHLKNHKKYYNITQDKRKDVESVEPTLSEPIPGHHLTGGAVATESFLSHFAESSKQLYIATESTKLRRIPMAQSSTNHNTLRSMPLSFSSNGKIDFIKIIETNKKIYIFFTEVGFHEFLLADFCPMTGL